MSSPSSYSSSSSSSDIDSSSVRDHRAPANKRPRRLSSSDRTRRYIPRTPRCKCCGKDEPCTRIGCEQFIRKLHEKHPEVRGTIDLDQQVEKITPIASALKKRRQPPRHDSYENNAEGFFVHGRPMTTTEYEQGSGWVCAQTLYRDHVRWRGARRCFRSQTITVRDFDIPMRLLYSSQRYRRALIRAGVVQTTSANLQSIAETYINRSTQ